MSWVQHKKQSVITSSSLSPSTNSSSSVNAFHSTSSFSINSSQLKTCPPISNCVQPLPQTVPMASQYSNKANTSLQSPSKMGMRINPSSPYHPLSQQQLHQQTLNQQQTTSTQRHNLQQQTTHQSNIAIQQPPPQVAQQTTFANSNASHMQGDYNNSSQQQNSWAGTKAMQPITAAPSTLAAAVGTSNNWPQQQEQENFQNFNMHQQNTAPQQQQQQWPQSLTSNLSYDNYYQHQANNNIFQQQQTAQLPSSQQQVTSENAAVYFQPQPTTLTATQIQTNQVNLFDQSFNNNQTSSADGWDDWDWNDNLTVQPHPNENEVNASAETATNAVQLPTQPLQPLIQQQGDYDNSILTDSFSTQNNNDSWNWGSKNNDQHVANAEPPNSDKAKQVDNWHYNHQSNDTEKQQQYFSATFSSATELNSDNWKWHAANENQQHITAKQNLNEVNTLVAQQAQIDSSPPPPPPTNFSSLVSENHNYNTNTTTTTPNNIPNTVFVTQAKPVTLPSRQYASPPGGSTPIKESPPETTLMPPQGFQNIDDNYDKSTAIGSPPLPPSEMTAPPMANVASPPAMPIANNINKSGNPFKRSGMAQHHRASGLLSTNASLVGGLPPEPGAFNIPPPPPADFANPVAITLMQPDNNEVPSQENREVLTPLTAQIPLPNVSIQTSAAAISLPNSLTQAPPPPNDERNQYLQTSHLSENAEEQQPEVDGLLPPPGLSRLVLGEPELEASQQRLVMGTEAPNNDNILNQVAVMHLEERHADGEDTASENAAPLTISAGQGVANNSSSLSSDRNLYMVPGESNVVNNNQQQRVVTGVELAEQREIEMDGENLEDEQNQHQQQQHQTQNIHSHPVLSVEARNEPPLEGADDTVVAPSTITINNAGHLSDEDQDNQHHHLSNQLTKIKDSHPISSPNDDDNSDERLLNERVLSHSTAGSSKSRSKYDNDRLTVTSRRRDKCSSLERYESDEYLNSEEEYSSEREERERRDRDRRRNYREGSTRSDRGTTEEDNSSRRHRISNKRDKYYYEGEERHRDGRDERERGRGLERAKTERRAQHQRGYDEDSRYETEESTRFDGRKDILRRSSRRSDQHDEYDDYNRRAGYRSSKRTGDNYESDRRERRRSDKHREPRYGDDTRYDPREYEDYRKHSSRNARGSDAEKEGPLPLPLRSARNHHDPRHAAAMYGYPSGSYYDAYSAYYYQQMARTNSLAYAEWYKRYYGQKGTAAGVTIGSSDRNAPNAVHANTSFQTSGNDGRESVHSGRSSAHNDRYTHAYITQDNDYHRHYQQQQHLHQQHYHHQQQQMAYNQTLNSTMLDDENLNHNASLYSGLGNLSLARSHTNLSQIHGGYYLPATATTAAGAYYARSDYEESRSGALSVGNADSLAQEPQRLTPCKFNTEHTMVNFSSGILVTVKPKYTYNGSINNIVKMLKFKPNDETRKLFKVFPGPLVRGLTHKKTVIEFCQDQIRLGPMATTIYAKQFTTNNSKKYRGSYTLMWNLLILLLKQNGMVVGTDIAELLLKNQQQFPYETPISTANNSLKSKSGSSSPIEELNSNMDAAGFADGFDRAPNIQTDSLAEGTEKLKMQEELEDNSLLKSSSNSVSLNEEEITEKFRNYLLYGNVNEALEWATDNNLWGHALFLASKLNRRSHANVMMKFANKLSLSDPLQTLYQLMSGRTPSSVTCVQDEKWGDWRPHLSMILSNTSQKPELDRKAITTLGDSLVHRGDLYAAHFCYLMAQVGFGRYQESAIQETSLHQHLPKLVLLGSSHYKPFREFAHNEAIITTEIYEYACSLNDEKFSITEFQPYKYLLATRLLDYGFHLRSLMYLEQIAAHIARDPTKYENSFITKVYEMADRLKYYDPALEKSIEEQKPSADDNSGVHLTPQHMEEQKWLQNLLQLVQQDKKDSRASATLAAQDTQQRPSLDPGYYNEKQQQIDQQFMEINKQFSELNLQYQQQVTAQTAEQQETQQPMIYNPEQQQHLAEQRPLDIYQQRELQQSLPNAKDLHTPVDSLQNVYQQQQPQFLQSETMQQLPSMGYNSNYSVDAAANNLGNQQSSNYEYWTNQQPLTNLQQEEPVLMANNDKDMQVLKKANQLAISKAGSTNNTFTTAPRKTSLALSNKKLSPKFKNHNSTHSTSNNAMGNFKFSATTTSPTITHPAKSALTTEKSLDLVQPRTESVTTAFNTLANSNTENMVTNPSNTPFSINNNVRPTITMPKSKSYDTDDENAAKRSQQQHQLAGNDTMKKSLQFHEQQSKSARRDDANKSMQHSNQNSGWFGGIWNKFSLKPKNQMILPDDKNPAIVWDAEKKKWVNTDGDEDEQESLKPPPKMSDLMPQAQQQTLQQTQTLPQQPQHQTQTEAPQQIPFMDLQQMPTQSQLQHYAPNPISQTASSLTAIQQPQINHHHQPQTPAPSKTPTLQSNMFKMQRNRTLKNAYVDVFNPSGAPINKDAENILAPALPPSTIPQGGFFIPPSQSSTTSVTGSMEEQAYQQQQQHDTPQFYNPNQFTSGAGY